MQISRWTSSYAKESCPTKDEILRPFLDLLLKLNLCHKSSFTMVTDMAKEIHSKLGNLDQSMQVKKNKFLNALSHIINDILGCFNLSKLGAPISLNFPNFGRLLSVQMTK